MAKYHKPGCSYYGNGRWAQASCTCGAKEEPIREAQAVAAAMPTIKHAADCSHFRCGLAATCDCGAVGSPTVLPLAVASTPDAQEILGVEHDARDDLPQTGSTHFRIDENPNLTDEDFEQYTISRGRYIHQTPFFSVWQAEDGRIGFEIKTPVPFFGLDPKAAFDLGVILCEASGVTPDNDADEAEVKVTYPSDITCPNCDSAQFDIPKDDPTARVCGCGASWFVVPPKQRLPLKKGYRP